MSLDFGVELGREEGEGGGGGGVVEAEEKRRIPVGGVAAMPLGQLASVLKQGRPSPQPRAKAGGGTGGTCSA